MLTEIGSELLGVLGSDNQNGHVEPNKSIQVLAQLRQVRMAEWSGKTSIEDQKNMLFFLEMRQAS